MGQTRVFGDLKAETIFLDFVGIMEIMYGLERMNLVLKGLRRLSKSR